VDREYVKSVTRYCD